MTLPLGLVKIKLFNTVIDFIISLDLKELKEVLSTEKA